MVESNSSHSPHSAFLQNLTSRPGVYSMLNAKGEVIYVGKAKNLKKRVGSYFNRQLDTKSLALVQQIHSINVTVTRNEREALLLESNLIKELQPHYNVIFRDDKSYPYLYLTTGDTFPRLSFYRGDRKVPGKYYGPYPSAGKAREALAFLQGIFKLRQCDNTFFKNRLRPCLQYQIKRCTAPCVGYIDEKSYQQDVQTALLFLEGKSDAVIEQLIHSMEQASEKLDFEKAARLRDQIALLRLTLEQQIIVGSKIDADVIGAYIQDDLACIHLLMIRDGRMLGSRHYFPNSIGVLIDAEEMSVPLLLNRFIMQHYLKVQNGLLPDEILVPCNVDSQTELEEILNEVQSNQLAKKTKTKIRIPQKGLATKWIAMAMQSAKEALKSRLVRTTNLMPRFEALQIALELDAIPERIECFDVSHTLGEATVAACVVFDTNGPVKNDYRRFNIKGVTPGDDYGALKQALSRHYTRLKSEGGSLPDILLIDGGKGQLKQAVSVLNELQVTAVVILGVAKGPGRKAGLETIYRPSGETLALLPDSKALLLIQQIRDEAHRFAISTHRNQRRKQKIHSRLEDIKGVGKARRLALLRRFGGLQEVKQATLEDIAKVPGINQILAERIYEALHGE